VTTEDASVVADKACQIEASLDRTRSGTAEWWVPACNFGANIEWQAGAARAHEHGRSKFSEAYVQAKTVFAWAEDSPWNLGLVVGVTRRPLDAPYDGWHNPYALVPVSFTPPDSVYAVHANLGWRRERHGARDLTLWGIAAEAGVAQRLTILGEAYGENAARPWLRIGARYGAARGLDFDLSLAARPGGTGQERFVSVGVTWQSGRILP
jgi:hypothetical protein